MGLFEGLVSLCCRSCMSLKIVSSMSFVLFSFYIVVVVHLSICWWFKQDADNFRRSPIKDATESVDDSGGRGYRSLHDFAESSYLLKLRSVYTNLESPKGLYIQFFLNCFLLANIDSTERWVILHLRNWMRVVFMTSIP